MDKPCYLFLDFDGVLHPKTADASLYFVDLPHLESVLRHFPMVEIVIASSWRHVQPLEVLRMYFSAEIRTRIIGVTPDIAPAAGYSDVGSRQTEVTTWILRNGDPSHPWVALDDEPRLYVLGAPVVVTKDGFGATEANCLRSALRDPVSFALTRDSLATEPLL